MILGLFPPEDSASVRLCDWTSPAQITTFNLYCTLHSAPDTAFCWFSPAMEKNVNPGCTRTRSAFRMNMRPPQSPQTYFQTRHTSYAMAHCPTFSHFEHCKARRPLLTFGTETAALHYSRDKVYMTSSHWALIFFAH